MAPDRTELINELTKLRRGQGLTPKALSGCPLLLEVLGNLPLEQAMRKISKLAEGLGHHEPAKVLRIAYALEGDPTIVLSARRKHYHRKTGRDIKTLIRYEDKMIDELATQLLSDQRCGLFVCAWVRQRCIYQAVIEHETRTAATPEDVEAVLKNRDNDPSLPLWVYRLPPHYTPTTLMMGVMFKDEDPKDIWAISAEDLHNVSTYRAKDYRVLHDRPLDWYFIEYRQPVQNRYYGVGWAY